jgi:hypothetical protein
MKNHAITAIIALVAFGAWAVATPPLVFAAYTDYTILDGPYDHLVGPNGTYLIEDSTSINPADIQSFWTSATGYSRVVVPPSPVDCGNTETCTLIDSESAPLNWVVSCSLPAVAYEAALYIDTPSEYNLQRGIDIDCHGMGSEYHPIYVLVLDSAANHFTFVGRHELGHALGLPDTSTTCDYSGSTYLPLMNNGTFGTCSSYGSNYNASYNEAQAVISLNGWN